MSKGPFEQRVIRCSHSQQMEWVSMQIKNLASCDNTTQKRRMLLSIADSIKAAKAHEDCLASRQLNLDYHDR